ncbi:hypothetical protein EDC28_102459 [Gallaecimonas pentaromativorans]|uniref:Uncharacterized protein n=1 Tax=Gallaecimonas pentaromativorans TaxID=584787 RepID=A0A3N1PZR6_9GAMM|nr:hypothetical protein EDC28_102459 [Gallaecimonas pentaromativorans]
MLAFLKWLPRLDLYGAAEVSDMACEAGPVPWDFAYQHQKKKKAS